MYFVFACLALLFWSGSDLFSKRGTYQKDKMSHWKVIFFVGLIMGIHAIVCLIASNFIPPLEEGADGEWWRSLIYTDFVPMDFVRYLPVAFIYLAAMVVGYVGLRYVELSISSPICNSSGSLAFVICVILGCAGLSELESNELAFTIVGVVLITVGIIFLSIVEYREDEEIKLKRQNPKYFKYTKSLWAILIPVIYLIMDALGTVGDQVINKFKIFVISDFAANTAFELTSLCFAIFAFIFVKFIKKEKFFSIPKENTRSLIIGGACETMGQIFYMPVMFSEFTPGIVIISAYCVLSVVWSRIFLKEKLSLKHYLAIFMTFAGIILLGIFSPV